LKSAAILDSLRLGETPAETVRPTSGGRVAVSGALSELGLVGATDQSRREPGLASGWHTQRESTAHACSTRSRCSLTKSGDTSISERTQLVRWFGCGHTGFVQAGRRDGPVLLQDGENLL
jgi:hypothetical protein